MQYNLKIFILFVILNISLILARRRGCRRRSINAFDIDPWYSAGGSSVYDNNTVIENEIEPVATEYPPLEDDFVNPFDLVDRYHDMRDHHGGGRNRTYKYTIYYIILHYFLYYKSVDVVYPNNNYRRFIGDTEYMYVFSFLFYKCL